MRTSRKILTAMQVAAVVNVTLLPILWGSSAGVVVSAGFIVVVTVLGVAALFIKNLEERTSRVFKDRSVYLPDAEREIDAMGLNGPRLRGAKAEASTKDDGYVIAGRVFPSPDDLGWHASGGSFFHGGSRGIQVYSGSTLHTIDIACVNVANGRDAMLYAKAIKAAQAARALATLPIATKDGQA